MRLLAKLETLGSNPLLFSVGLIDLLEMLLLASFFIRGETTNPFLHIFWVALVPITISLRDIAYRMIYQDGTFAAGANPPLKPKAQKWFLILYLPLPAISAVTVGYTLYQDAFFRLLAAGLLLVLKVLLLRAAWQRLDPAQGQGEAL